MELVTGETGNYMNLIIENLILGCDVVIIAEWSNESRKEREWEFMTRAIAKVKKRCECYTKKNRQTRQSV